jgi:putative phosphoribosyl transferase
MVRRFRNRTDAGQQLARALIGYADRSDVVVLALPRGGVPVAFEVSRGLRAPLDVFVVRKLGVPGQEELAMGAIASGGVRVINDRLVRELRIPASAVDRVAASEARELERRERLYRGTRTGAPLAGRTVILVDDGLATGATMLAGVKAIRQRDPARIVVAVPVAAPQACAALAAVADQCVCVLQRPALEALGLWYEDFSQTEDDEVRGLLDRSTHELLAPAG